jgi:hypothetical protein
VGGSAPMGPGGLLDGIEAQTTQAM